MYKISKEIKNKISDSVNNPQQVGNENHICKYCGKKANFKFKNGVYCCSRYLFQCSEIKRRKKISFEKTKKEKGISPKKFRIVYIENSKHLCDYGCSQIAHYQFGNEKYCCSEHWRGCPAIKEKYSEMWKGENNPMYNIGKNHPLYGKKHTKKTKEKMSEARKEYFKEHPEMKPIGKKNGMYGKKASKETRRKMNKSNHWKGNGLQGFIDLYGLAIGPWKYISFIEKCKESKKKDWKEGKYDNRKSCHSKIYYMEKDGKMISLHSSWERKIARLLDKHNIKWLRPLVENGHVFNWMDGNNEPHTYTPDFYLQDYDIYLEPHSSILDEIYKEKDTVNKIKRVSEQNNIRVLILGKDELNWKSIRNLL